MESYYIPYGGGFYTMAALTGPEYAAACNVMGDDTMGVSESIKNAAGEAIDLLPKILIAVEGNKALIKGAEDITHAGMLVARGLVMQQVADANYRNDGNVDVDLVPTVLTSDWGGFTTKYSNDDRARFAEVTRLAAYGPTTGDAFVRERSWTASQLIPTDWQCMLLGWQRNQVRRRGGTELINYDEWKAEDTASYHYYTGGFKWWGGPKCNHHEEPLGWGEQQAHPSDADQDDSGASLGGSPATNPEAHAQASSTDWTNYTGLPSCYDLSAAMLAKNSNLKEDDAALLKYTVRVRRQIDQTVTSEGRSDVKTTPTLNGYHADAAKDQLTGKQVLAQIATSEVFFRRPPEEYANGFGGSAKPVELGSLFNPYWQVRLVTTPASDFVAAKLLQGSTGF